MHLIVLKFNTVKEKCLAMAVSIMTSTGDFVVNNDLNF